MMPMMASTTIQPAQLRARRREHRHAEAQQSVGAHLQHHGRQHHGTGGGRLHVRIGQPGVQREQRNLDRERDEERQEQPELFARREI